MKIRGMDIPIFVVMGIGVTLIIVGIIEERRANRALKKAEKVVNKLKFWSAILKTFEGYNFNVEENKDCPNGCHAPTETTKTTTAKRRRNVKKNEDSKTLTKE